MGEVVVDSKMEVEVVVATMRVEKIRMKQTAVVFDAGVTAIGTKTVLIRHISAHNVVVWVILKKGAMKGNLAIQKAEKRRQNVRAVVRVLKWTLRLKTLKEWLNMERLSMAIQNICRLPLLS